MKSVSLVVLFLSRFIQNLIPHNTANYTPQITHPKAKLLPSIISPTRDRGGYVASVSHKLSREEICSFIKLKNIEEYCYLEAHFSF